MFFLKMLLDIECRGQRIPPVLQYMKCPYKKRANCRKNTYQHQIGF